MSEEIEKRNSYGMMERDDLVALKRIPARHQFVHLGNGNEYVFAMSHNIALAWVQKSDVAELVAMKKGCCGGRKKRIFYEALEHDVRRHENGGR